MNQQQKVITEFSSGNLTDKAVMGFVRVRDLLYQSYFVRQKIQIFLFRCSVKNECQHIWRVKTVSDWKFWFYRVSASTVRNFSQCKIQMTSSTLTGCEMVKQNFLSVLTSLTANDKYTEILFWQSVYLQSWIKSDCSWSRFLIEMVMNNDVEIYAWEEFGILGFICT